MLLYCQGDTDRSLLKRLRTVLGMLCQLQCNLPWHCPLCTHTVHDTLFRGHPGYPATQIAL